MADAGASVVVSQQPQQHGGTLTTLAGSLFDSFRNTPMLLLVVVLNGFFVAAAGFYLIKVEDYRAKDRAAASELLSKCLTDTVPIEYLKILEQRK